MFCPIRIHGRFEVSFVYRENFPRGTKTSPPSESPYTVLQLFWKKRRILPRVTKVSTCFFLFAFWFKAISVSPVKPSEHDEIIL